MDEQAKRAALRKYFAKPFNPVPSIVLIAGGALVALLGLTQGNNGGACLIVGIGGVVLGAVIWGLAAQNTGGAPTDAQVDEWFAEDLKNIAAQSLSKLGMVKEQLVKEPLLVTGPILWTTTGVPATDLLWKKGKDEMVRFAINRVTAVQLTDQQLGAYACDFNFLKNVALNERTDEYHYRDVVSVSTQEVATSYTLPTGVKMVQAQAFRLAVSSGDHIDVTINAAELAKITQGTIPTTGAEKAVATIRAMLREKKQ